MPARVFTANVSRRIHVDHDVAELFYLDVAIAVANDFLAIAIDLVWQGCARGFSFAPSEAGLDSEDDIARCNRAREEDEAGQGWSLAGMIGVGHGRYL